MSYNAMNILAKEGIGGFIAPQHEIPSMFIFSGSLIGSRDVGGVEITRAPTITNASEGSHWSKRFKKPKTFAGLIISEITRPIPKTIPQNNDTILFIKYL